MSLQCHLGNRKDVVVIFVDMDASLHRTDLDGSHPAAGVAPSSGPAPPTRWHMMRQALVALVAQKKQSSPDLARQLYFALYAVWDECVELLSPSTALSGDIEAAITQYLSPNLHIRSPSTPCAMTEDAAPEKTAPPPAGPTLLDDLFPTDSAAVRSGQAVVDAGSSPSARPPAARSFPFALVSEKLRCIQAEFTSNEAAANRAARAPGLDAPADASGLFINVQGILFLSRPGDESSALTDTATAAAHSELAEHHDPESMCSLDVLPLCPLVASSRGDHRPAWSGEDERNWIVAECGSQGVMCDVIDPVAFTGIRSRALAIGCAVAKLVPFNWQRYRRLRQQTTPHQPPVRDGGFSVAPLAMMRSHLGDVASARHAASTLGCGDLGTVMSMGEGTTRPSSSPLPVAGATADTLELALATAFCEGCHRCVRDRPIHRIAVPRSEPPPLVTGNVIQSRQAPHSEGGTPAQPRVKQVMPSTAQVDNLFHVGAAATLSPPAGVKLGVAVTAATHVKSTGFPPPVGATLGTVVSVGRVLSNPGTTAHYAQVSPRNSPTTLQSPRQSPPPMPQATAPTEPKHQGRSSPPAAEHPPATVAPREQLGVHAAAETCCDGHEDTSSAQGEHQKSSQLQLSGRRESHGHLSLSTSAPALPTPPVGNSLSSTSPNWEPKRPSAGDCVE